MAGGSQLTDNEVTRTADKLVLAEEALAKVVLAGGQCYSDNETRKIARQAVQNLLAIFGDALIAHHKACEAEARRQAEMRTEPPDLRFDCGVCGREGTHRAKSLPGDLWRYRCPECAGANESLEKPPAEPPKGHIPDFVCGVCGRQATRRVMVSPADFWRYRCEVCAGNGGYFKDEPLDS